MCYQGDNEIGEYLERIYSVTMYISEFSNYKIKNYMGEIKQGEYTEEMAEILEWGVENFDGLDDVDYLVPPPRGDQDADVNHMKEIGERLSDKVDIPTHDPLRKAEEYQSQKEIEDPEERMENIKDNINSIEDFEGSPTVVLIDDIATTAGTLKYSAKALRESGADHVIGLALARTESLDNLEDSEVYKPEDNDN